MKLMPKDYRLLIQVDEVKEGITEGGVIMPDMHAEVTRPATVLAVGKTVKDYKVGNRVMVMYGAGTDLHSPAKGILQDTYRIIAESNILCEIVDEAGRTVEGVSEEK